MCMLCFMNKSLSVLFICACNFLQPDSQSKPQKEGAESEQFWDLLGGKSEYPSQKIGRDAESDPHLFSCNFKNGIWWLSLIAGESYMRFFFFNFFHVL